MLSEPWRCRQGRVDAVRAVEMPSGPCRCRQGRVDAVRAVEDGSMLKAM